MNINNLKLVVFVLATFLMIFNFHIETEAQNGENTDTILAVSDRTTAVQDAIVAAVDGVTDAANVTNTQLAAITSLNLRNKSITVLKSGDFDGMTGLTSLNLYGNQLSSLPNGIFEGLTALTTLRLGGNTTDPMQVGIYVEHIDGNNYKVVVPTGAPFAITVALEISDGVNPEALGNQTVSKGSVESASFTAASIVGTTVEIGGTLPSLPRNHYGYELAKIDPPSDETTTEEVSTPENNPPEFTDGETTTRSIAENTAAATNIGTAIGATDSDTDDTLTYTLGGTDAASFDIVSTSGQLQTKAALDYETKSSYTVIVTVSDSNGGSDTITVTINVTDVTEEVVTETDDEEEEVENNAPSFTDGTITLRSIAENTAADTNIGTAVGATDEDSDDTLTYTLGGRDAASFAIESTTGQLKTKAALDYETKSVYLVSITVSDTSDTDTISVVISIIDVADTTISTAAVGVSDRTPEVRDAIVAAVPNVTDAANVTDTHLAAITSLNLRNKGITALKTGDFSGLTNLRTLNLYGNSLSALPNGIFNGLTSLTSLRSGGNTVSPMPIFVSLEQVSSNQYRVVIPAGAPFDVAVPLLLTDGISRPEELGTLTVSKGTIRSSTQTVPVVSGAYIDMGALPALPANHFGYTLSKSATCNVTKAVADAIAAAVPGVTDCRNVSEAQLAAITSLDLSSDSITSLQSNDFAGLLSLATLNLESNQLSSFPDGIFADLTSLTTLQLTGNTGAPFSFEVSLEKVGTNQFKAVMPIGAPFDVVLPISVTNGSAAGSATSITISQGSVESGTLTVTRTLNTLGAVTVDIGTLPSIPTSHNGYALSKSSDLPLTIFEAVNVAPVFTEGTSATRSIAENSAPGTNIGTPVAATDGNSTDTLVYSLTGTDASSFTIVASTGQLQTRAALDFETKDSYTVIVNVTDNNLSDTITVTIDVTDIVENVAPVFTDGASTTRSIAENTVAGTNIGTPVAATDGNSTDTLVYSLTGTDASSFTIVASTGQLQTRAALDFETKDSYTVIVNVTDNNLSDTITVTIDVTDIVENVAPVFTDGASTTRSIAENTVAGTNIGTPVAATDGNSTDTLVYSLTGTDASSFTIVASTGQLQTRAALDFETKDSYTVIVNVTDNNLSDTITVTIDVTDVVENVAPVFTDGTSTTRSIAENTAAGTNIGTPVEATDANGDDTLTYTLSGTDAATFDIVSTTGQLQTKNALNYEQKNSYSVTVTVSDGEGGSDSINVTINVTDVKNEGTQQQVERNVPETPSNNAPTFTDGLSTTRSVAENTESGSNIGTPVAATDQDLTDTLTYTLGGTDASSFSIVGTTGQLRTSAALDYETKSSYTVTVNVSDDNGGTDSIAVTINVTDVANESTEQTLVTTNNVPSFTDGASTTRSIAENTVSGTNIGAPIAATDADTSNEIPDVLSYSLSGTDAASFSIDSASGQLQTSAALDFETKDSYTVTVSVSDGKGGTDSITVTINVTDVNEDAGPNVAPVFTEGDSTYRLIESQPDAGENVGDPITATDANNDTLTYSLSGTHANRFNINSATGQLSVKVGGVGFSYWDDAFRKSTVIVTVSDSNGGTDTITVNVHLISAHGNHAYNNHSPFFADAHLGVTYPEPLYTFIDITDNVREFEIAENSHIGSLVASIYVADEDISHQNKMRSSISGPDADLFTVNDSGRLDITAIFIGGPLVTFSITEVYTDTALDYETKEDYSIVLTVTDLEGATDTLSLNIKVTDVNEAPSFSDGSSATRSIAENVSTGTSVGSAVSATDPEGEDLTYTLSGTDAASFSISSTTGQLTTSSAIDYETKPSYTVTVTASDGTNSTDITVTIRVTDLNEVVTQNAPVFTNGTSTSRSVAENSASGTNIGSAVSATDADPGTTLAYSLSGTDASSFGIVGRTGQLLTSAALDYETKASYSVTITVSDGNLSDTIAVTINVTDANDAPEFDEGTTTTRTVGEEVVIGTIVGNPVDAVDQDRDVLNYTLSGTDAASFTIDSSTGQLRTAVELDFDTKRTYSVVVTATDNETGTDADTDTPLSDTITVTINVGQYFPGSLLPAFDELADDLFASITRSIDENTPSGTNIGSPVSATDPDADDELIYSLPSGQRDNGSFSIVSSTGQLQTSAALNHETKDSYIVFIRVTDGANAATTTATININDINDAPVFTDGTSITLTVAENTAAATNIGSAIAATDEDEPANTLTYTLSGTDAASFDVVSTSGQIQTKADLDFETKLSYSVTLSVSDGNQGTDSIAVTINVTDVTEVANEPPEFSDGATATRSIPENTASGSNVGAAFTATDPDSGDTVSYSLSGTDAASFSVNSSTGQLTTATTFDFETKTSYTVIITASDGKPNNGKDTITVTINITDVTENNDPVFTDGESVTRSLDETAYTADVLSLSWENIGDPITATDADNDTITYAITNSSSLFRIQSSGQLQGIGLDHETTASHTLTITATDTNNGSDSISVTVTVNDINEIPTISSDNESTLSFSAGTAASTNLGSIYTAYDYDDSDTLTFSLAGTNADKFQLSTTTTATYAGSDGYAVQATAQLQNKAELTAGEFSVVIEASDTAGLKATTGVTINVIGGPFPAVADRTAAVRDAIVAAIDGVDSASDITGTHLESITALDLSSQSISSLSAGDFNGMSSLTSLDLSDNLLGTSLPDGIFSGLSLSTLDLSGNTGTPAIVLSMERVADSDSDIKTADVRVKVNTAAPFDMQVDVLTHVKLCLFGFCGEWLIGVRSQQPTISAGSIYSDTFVIDTDATTISVSVIGVSIDATTYPSLPSGHTGYAFNNSDDQPLEVLPDDEGTGAPSLQSSADSQRPETTALLPNFPNPFNPETWIPYQLNKPSDVTITIYDIQGNVVRHLDLGQKQAGYYTDRSRAGYWDGRNAVGERVANGVYFYQLKAGDYSYLRKMLIVK